MTYYGNAYMNTGLNEVTGASASIALTFTFGADLRVVAYWLRRTRGRGHSWYKRGR